MEKKSAWVWGRRRNGHGPGRLGCQLCEPSCGWAVPLADHRESRGLSTEPQSLGKFPPGQGHRGRKWEPGLGPRSSTTV